MAVHQEVQVHVGMTEEVEQESLCTSLTSAVA